jgi:hypothetical protein
MTLRNIIIILSSILLWTACDTINKTENNNESKIKVDSESTTTNINFKEATNYFVKNDYKDSNLHCFVLSNQISFDSIFGMATVMGNDGKPTPIDFSKENIIALIGQLTDIKTTLKIKSLNKKDNSFVLNYEFSEGEKESSTIRPLQLIVVDKTIQGDIILSRQN